MGLESLGAIWFDRDGRASVSLNLPNILDMLKSGSEKAAIKVFPGDKRKNQHAPDYSFCLKTDDGDSGRGGRQSGGWGGSRQDNRGQDNRGRNQGQGGRDFRRDPPPSDDDMGDVPF